ncbi:MAG: hypothetical protein GXX99_08120 [Clostridiales bacterium]|nr:hypothetical protein [Clostridiales bacterium]
MQSQEQRDRKVKLTAAVIAAVLLLVAGLFVLPRLLGGEQQPVSGSPDQQDGDTKTPGEQPSDPDAEQPVYDPAQIREYYDYFTQNAAMLNPIFDYPSGDEAIDRRNLFLAGVRMSVYGIEMQEVPRPLFDALLMLHFGQTLEVYDGPEGRIEEDRVIPAGDVAKVTGKNRFVLTDLTAEKDDSYTGIFMVYHLPDGDAVDEARLRRGLVADYGDYYACTAVIRFRRLEDKETVHLQFVRIAIEEDAGLMVTIEP